MSFMKLSELKVSDGSAVRTIAVYHGDLTAIPEEHAVDILVLSAFRNDYLTTSTSLIGALDAVGLSVGELAADKEHDLRSTCAFWLSKPISGALRGLHIGRIACFESGFRGPPTAVVGDLFRGLFPFVSGANDFVVAMPLLAAGDQQYPPAVMFDAIIYAASHWMARGLSISELKIVIRDRPIADALASRLKQVTPPAPVQAQKSRTAFDVFLSFSSADTDGARVVKDALQNRSDVGPIFDYRLAIDKGVSWQAKIDEAITSCRSIVTIISPNYIASPECQEELFQARLRHKREGGLVLFPIYWRKWEGDLALWLQLISAADCREADTARLAASVSSLTFRAAL
jgi:hypothetical protein